ncbi:ligand-binding sensor domain-containing protein [Chryseobacterium indoltheticum]|uniref:ligand-binding sensor domain-containing protein n=1 Tax=Chryseobacterium indoltheticum TaxID=254 RepID=UPI003F499504
MSVDEGLPQSFVSALEQDNEGFVWIGTRNGLSRYDGKNFKTFQHHFNNKNSLASNTVDHLRKGRENGLWIKYETAGIDYFDINSGKIDHIINEEFLDKNNITIHRKYWLVTQDNFLWFKSSANEIFNFDIQRKILKRQNLNLNSDETIYNILEDKSKNIWILTQKNLKIFDKKINKFLNISIPYNMFANKLQQNNKEAALFYQRKNGELMWADKERFYFFDPIKKLSEAKNYRFYRFIILNCLVQILKVENILLQTTLFIFTIRFRGLKNYCAQFRKTDHHKLFLLIILA